MFGFSKNGIGDSEFPLERRVDARGSAGGVEDKASCHARTATTGPWCDGQHRTVKGSMWQHTDLGSNPSSVPSWKCGLGPANECQFSRL